jgi:predicted nucleic acid-binding protein
VDRLFLDANILFSAAYRPNTGLTRLWAVKGAALVTSEYAISEAEKNLAEPEQRARLEELLKDVERRPSTTLSQEQRNGVELREKDWPILAGALEAEATHLFTGDSRDFGRYFGTSVLGILVQTPAAYLRSGSM